MSIQRRTFLKTVGAAMPLAGFAWSSRTAGTGTEATPVRQAAQAASGPVRLGVDLYSVRSQGWTPIQYLDWCAKWGAKVVHFSEIRFIGSLDADNLRRVRAHADTLGLDLEIGMRSICPTSITFDKEQGTAEEQLLKMVAAARIVRSPIVRCVLGNSTDRRGPGGIDAHIDTTVKVLKNVRPQVIEAGVKVAIENHAGDMQARELKRLIEAAGPEFVGVCIDSGNAVWTIEDPHLTLETLAPFVLTSHMRDSSVWNTPQGAAVQWMRMGEGNVGIEAYIRNYIRLCPGRAVSLEVIVSAQPRLFNYRNPPFWDIYRNTPASDFARFLALVEKGTAPAPVAPVAAGPAAAARELADVEASLTWTKAALARIAG